MAAVGFCGGRHDARCVGDGGWGGGHKQLLVVGGRPARATMPAWYARQWWPPNENTTRRKLMVWPVAEAPRQADQETPCSSAPGGRHHAGYANAPAAFPRKDD